MRKLKVKINGVKYKYEITENKTIRVDDIVSIDIYTTIEERAIPTSSRYYSKSIT